MILIIRGHIRSSFKNKDLYDFIKNLYLHNPDLSIFIHTWTKSHNNLSWRKFETLPIDINEKYILNYFFDLHNIIKKIIIEDDEKIEIIGNTEGNIPGTLTPIRGWKNYWYSKYKIIDYINNYNINDNITDDTNTNNKLIINIRFDVFLNLYSFSQNQIFEFIEKNKDQIMNQNIFLYKYFFLGCDNFYIGNINTMFQLSQHFHYNLDKIIKDNNNHITHQEGLVMIENSKLFDTDNKITITDVEKFANNKSKFKSFIFMNHQLKKVN